MRVYSDFHQAKDEIRRDLAELGSLVNAGYQSQEGDYETRELLNYDYRVVTPRPEDLEPVQPWANAEWRERRAGLRGMPLNPGTAWESRTEVWAPLLEEDKRFSYTYSERFANNNFALMMDAFANNASSRQVWISVWDPRIDSLWLGRRRVPCSIGYQLVIRDGKLDITYVMRSSDFQTHFDNDCWMALKLQAEAKEELHFRGVEVERGAFVHQIGSLHVYQKEVVGVF